MMKCNVCGEFFNPAMLSEVLEHEKKDIRIRTFSFIIGTGNGVK